MTQSEFLETLRDALSGQIPSDEVMENLRYYRSYISDEMKKGRSQQDILDELGDPRLIARTILDASSAAGPRRDSRSREDLNTPFRQEDSREEETHSYRKSFRISRWALTGIFFLILFLFFSVLFFMFRTIFRLLFSFHGIWFWAIVILMIYFLSRKK